MCTCISDAMENWGMVTYREVVLLVDSATTIRQKSQVAMTIAHELAHMWFGNLVTMVNNLHLHRCKWGLRPAKPWWEGVPVCRTLFV